MGQKGSKVNMEVLKPDPGYKDFLIGYLRGLLVRYEHYMMPDEYKHLEDLMKRYTGSILIIPKDRTE